MNLTNPISAICLQECWLNDIDNVTMFNLDGYELFSQPNQCCAHGGLIIYVRYEIPESRFMFYFLCFFL